MSLSKHPQTDWKKSMNFSQKSLLVLLTPVLIQGCGNNSIEMSCSGVITYMNQSGVTGSSPQKMNLRVTTQNQSSQNSLVKDISELNLDGKKYQICNQTNEDVTFLVNCNESGPQKIENNNTIINNVTYDYKFNKLKNTMTMDSTYRSGYMYVNNTTIELQCK